MDTALPFGLVPCSTKRVRCLFCGSYISKQPKYIDEHMNGANHKDNIALMDNNGISFINGVLYCWPCKVDITDNSVAMHIEEDYHEDWISSMESITEGQGILLDEYLSAKSAHIYCNICSVYITCTIEQVQEHILLTSHRCGIVENMKPQNGFFTQPDNTVWCKLCNLVFDNNTETIIDHIVKVEHRNWLLTIEDLIEGQDMYLAGYLTAKDYNYISCRRCKLEVECNPLAIENHICSSLHLFGHRF